MMIAKKLLACATPAPATTTLLLWDADASAGNVPMPVIGQINNSQYVSSDGVGGAVFSSRTAFLNGGVYVSDIPTSDYSGSFILECVFYGQTAPDITDYSGSGSLIFALYQGGALVSTDGETWNHGLNLAGLFSAGENHVAIGRQSGVVQVWVNGSRVYRADDGYPASGVMQRPGIANTTTMPMTIGGVRITSGVEIYGDNPVISVPTLPMVAV